MSNKTKNGILPELRFPEFGNTEKWTVEPLEKLYSFKSTNSFSRDDLNYENGEVKNIHYGDIHTKFSSLFNITKEKVPYINSSVSIEKIAPESYCIEGDVVFADASEDLNDIGKSIEIINVNNEKLLAGMHTLLARQKQPKLIVGFGGHLFGSKGIRTQIQRESQGTKVLGISSGRLSNVRVYYPINTDEQKKIADCLSSIDELITAQSQKLDALKAHKRGLMQQLFPAEGETVPELRFPEFKNDKEWVCNEFSEYIKLYRGSSPRPIQNYLTSESDGVNWIKIGDTKYANNFIIKRVEETITTAGASKSRKVNIGELILANSMSFGKTYMLAIEGYIYDGWFVLREYEKDFDKGFLLQLLNSEYMQNQYKKLSAGGIVQNISSDIVYQTILPHTSINEQRKISSCLSAVDELITAKAEKIEQLKAHKKGLMQQLFPMASEAE